MIITVYELLGLIKDGKAPKKIKYENIIWKYNMEENEYIKEINEDYGLFQDYFPNNLNFMDCLNDKVEILEEDKPIIEKIKRHKFEENGITISEQPSIIEIADKLNEVIDYINRKEDK